MLMYQRQIAGRLYYFFIWSFIGHGVRDRRYNSLLRISLEGESALEEQDQVSGGG